MQANQMPQESARVAFCREMLRHNDLHEMLSVVSVCPPYSPDLNPINNLWAHIARAAIGTQRRSKPSFKRNGIMSRSRRSMTAS